MEGGIQPEEAIPEEYSQLRMKRTHRYIIMKISDDKSKIEIEHIGTRTAVFEEFKE